MVALGLTVRPHAFAQEPSTNPPVPPTQAAPGPNAGQAQQGAPGETVQNGQQQVQLIASPWTRYCAKTLFTHDFGKILAYRLLRLPIFRAKESKSLRSSCEFTPARNRAKTLELAG